MKESDKARLEWIPDVFMLASFWQKLTYKQSASLMILILLWAWLVGMKFLASLNNTMRLLINT